MGTNVWLLALLIFAAKLSDCEGTHPVSSDVAQACERKHPEGNRN